MSTANQPTTSGEWEVHEGEDYLVILGGEHDHTENPIATFYERELADRAATAVNAYEANQVELAQLQSEVERLRELLCRVDSEWGSPHEYAKSIGLECAETDECDQCDLIRDYRAQLQASRK